MNVLAHIYLSGDSDKIIIGNYIGDYVKGKDYLKYPPALQKGLLLHRHIDTFTDNHTIVKRDKVFFFERYQKYAGVVTDIIYDHYLATEWKTFSGEDINKFVEHIHTLIQDNYTTLPEGLQRLVPYIIKNRWFKSYFTLDGVRSVLIGMAKGTSLPDESAFAIRQIEKNYDTLKKDFLEFFPEIITAIGQDENLIG